MLSLVKLFFFTLIYIYTIITNKCLNFSDYAFGGFGKECLRKKQKRGVTLEEAKRTLVCALLGLIALLKPTVLD